MSPDFGLISHLTAAENVALPLRIANASAGQTAEHVTELLRWVGLGEEFDELPAALSRTGRNRGSPWPGRSSPVPICLLVDEPTGNFDENVAMRLIHLVEELNKVGHDGGRRHA